MNTNDRKIKFVGHRIENIYMINLDKVSFMTSQSLISKSEDMWLWHIRLGHIHMDNLNKLVSKGLVVGLPKLKFEKNKLCDVCQKGKQTKVPFIIKKKKRKHISTTTTKSHCNYYIWIYLVLRDL